MAYSEELKQHLAEGATTVARAWAIKRRDGVVIGFTDHDCALEFEGLRFAPDSGMTAKALSQSTGLSVDNTESYGALSSDAISEADILAGRYDGAEVRAWIVNWTDVTQSALRFRGHLGEIVRGNGAFTAELRGLTEALSTANGRVYHARCPAVLGDGQCRFDLEQAGYHAQLTVEQVREAQVFRFRGLTHFEPRWFEKGRFRVVSGASKGLSGLIKTDRSLDDGLREIALWQRLGAEIVPGDTVRVEAGCDRRAETCRLKFGNFLNFRGFPHIPGEDWLMSYPVRSGANDGGSLFR